MAKIGYNIPSGVNLLLIDWDEMQRIGHFEWYMYEGTRPKNSGGGKNFITKEAIDSMRRGIKPKHVSKAELKAILDNGNPKVLTKDELKSIVDSGSLLSLKRELVIEMKAVSKEIEQVKTKLEKYLQRTKALK